MSERDVVNASLLHSLGERYTGEHDVSVAFSIDMNTAMCSRAVLWSTWLRHENGTDGWMSRHTLVEYERELTVRVRVPMTRFSSTSSLSCPSDGLFLRKRPAMPG
ncbi:hypothetical protein EVAR_52662_1 [Eumeta japonica]|uniref:Uncharacterized protein n=1 Tax=Eumeta variegata TaxID=151549 RepID=A0A4C1Z1J2_EUMVA|nr:hypothetical protein EVAR_52662_1 [Eumeta japonica]